MATDTKQYSPSQKLTAKDVAGLLIVSESTAKRYLADLKKHFNATIITYNDYATYFRLK